MSDPTLSLHYTSALIRIAGNHLSILSSPMPSAFSHAASAIALGYSFTTREKVKMIIIGSLCSVLPDADVLSFQFGIPYKSMWGHRGITHSFFFAAALAIFVMLIFYRKTPLGSLWKMLFLYFFLATSLHPLLDAFTNGGLGVAFFAPFNNERYFFPWRPIKVSPLSASAFFTSRGIQIIKSEFVWIWFPSIIFMIAVFIKRKK